jgi:competence protein ComEC
LAGIALTTIVASLATAPFVVYHFNRFAAYGLAANLAAVPITALWIMPWAMAAFLLMPFGLEAVALTPMGWGVGAVIAVAQVVSSWPGAVVRVPAMPVSGIALVALGGLWLGLWRRRWRFLGLGLILAGLASVPLSRPPDVLVDGDAKLVAVRGEDGALALSSTRKARFHGQVWLRRVGQEEAAAWPWGGASPDGRLACDALGCIYEARGQTVALVHDGRALAEDCGTAEVVVSLVPVRVPCPSPRRVIDRFDLWREGGHAVWLDPDDVRVETVRAWQGRRPWTANRGW